MNIENSSVVSDSSRAVTGDEMPQSAASAYSGSVVYNRKYSYVQKTASFSFLRNLGKIKGLVYSNSLDWIPLGGCVFLIPFNFMLRRTAIKTMCVSSHILARSHMIICSNLCIELRVLLIWSCIYFLNVVGQGSCSSRYTYRLGSSWRAGSYIW